MILTPDALQAALAGFTFPRMTRAWRNRSPVTQSHWTARALVLLGAAIPDDVWRLAAALYVACGECARADGVFDPATFSPGAWSHIAYWTRRYRDSLPEKALSRGAYEQHRKAAQSDLAIE